MARMRVGVVLMVPHPVAPEIDGLRRACGDRQRERIEPHLTLVPPVNIPVAELPAALAILRAAAADQAVPSAIDRAGATALDLRLGPPASFLPDSATLHLGVDGAPAALDRLLRLRSQVFLAPLARPRTWPYVPHVTIADDVEPGRIERAIAVLADFVVDVSFDRVHLLEEQRDGQGRRCWVPVADAPFARPAIVGRGGVELELTRSGLVDPEAHAFERGIWASEDRVPPEPSASPGSAPLVVAAWQQGRLVGVARGAMRNGEDPVLETITVAPDRRNQGVGRQLRLAFAAT